MQTVKKIFPVIGMSCASCAISVESMLQPVNGVVHANVNYAAQQVMVEYDESVVTPQKLKSVVQSIGYDLMIDEKGDIHKSKQREDLQFRMLQQKTFFAFLFSIPVVLISMVFMHVPYGNWMMMFLSIPVVFYFGRQFFINALKQARHGKANMDTLVALSTFTAFLFSTFTTIFPSFWISRGLPAHVYFEASVVIITFILLGKLLEEKAKSNTSSALKKLMQLQPDTVTIFENGAEKQILTAEVAIGNMVVMKPGEKVPVDGIVTKGTSFVDESMISGEYTPIEKYEGSSVYAGTINQKGHFIFRAEKVGGDTVLGHIIQLVQEAQGSKAPVQRLADKVAGIFVPVVMGIALLAFAVWLLLGGNDAFSHALLAFVTVLIIACPCALGLATPTAMMAGIGKGAENNILIKDAESLEAGYKVNAVVLDKTGTLTEGKPTVTEIVWNKTIADRHLPANILYALEAKSEHPLAEAVLNYIKKEQTDNDIHLTDFQSITGRGIRALFANKLWLVGNKRMIEEHKLSLNNELLSLADSWQQSAKTVVYFANDLQVLAIIGITDEIKPTALAAIHTLHEMGIAVYMLTGDNQSTAAAVAKSVGITHYTSDALPAQKAKFIQDLQQQGKIVAMVGDGINDSQALALANVSIAMGSGTDIAMDVAKITLITKDLTALPKALVLSAKTVRIIRENLFWAFIYNIIGIPIAAGILYPVNGFLLNPMIAGAAMAFSSVSVVLNSLRLKTIRL
ncbi:heavy metal translocating P-type ATPase [Hydrotalea sp.]|uniref:heavy metal translocating P-type ATPase n=1 Tax=Hydrotalea sp. TaxID=2881279 RepID=UPI002584DC1C|nr:heavy metal translocating P-type ATPase [Hydrotalea sp.]